jgi:REP element-mobilizing transposase RayT
MPRTHDRIVIAHHLILHGYGHWLPNDLRGSGSDEVREKRFSELGPIHYGRKKVQPPRDELREFFREAEPLLTFERLWFDDAKRQAIGESIGEVVEKQGYTCWGCAVLKNHVHLCIRRHRDAGRIMWHNFADATRTRTGRFANIHQHHPVWSERPYDVFLYTPDDVRRVIAYIRANPAKELIAPQLWSFVKEYDGWPHDARRGKPRRT